MEMLNIDRGELDPLIFCDLEDSCIICQRKNECSKDLACQFEARWDKWWMHCPNSAMLALISETQKYRNSAAPRPTTAAGSGVRASSLAQ
jgi:hypothetical protein